MAQTGQQSNRSNARSAATGAGQTQGSGRRPKPEEAAASGQSSEATNQPAEDIDPTKYALIVVAPHDKAKRQGTIAYDHYQNYPPMGELSDMFKCRKGEHVKAGSKYKEVRGKDISFDADPSRRHILTGQEALDFNEIAQGDPLGKNRDKCAEYLRDTIKVPEKTLIKWGYLNKPEPPAPEQTASSEQQKVTEPA